jgi:endonuclease-3
MPPKRPVPLRRAVKRPASGRSRSESLAARARRTAAILDALEVAHPEATCALHYSTPFQLVVATILSAQCTDERVNMVTPALFRRYPEPRDLAGANPTELEEIIRSTGFFRAKSKSLMGCARALVAEHDGIVPPRMDALVKLPGIGRKTANVVLGHVFDVNEGIAVDTHVLRVSNRLQIASGDDPIDVERQLMAIVPRERWTRITDLLIFHGRKICDARRPRCGVCPVFHLCRWESRQAFAALTTETSERRPTPPARADVARAAARRPGLRRAGARR